MQVTIEEDMPESALVARAELHGAPVGHRIEPSAGQEGRQEMESAGNAE
jgi:hypothetical protein